MTMPQPAALTFSVWHSLPGPVVNTRSSVQLCCADACDESPARQPSVIAVAATDSSDNMASFSDGGACVELLAPGVSILSVGYSTNTGYV